MPVSAIEPSDLHANYLAHQSDLLDTLWIISKMNRMANIDVRYCHLTFETEKTCPRTAKSLYFPLETGALSFISFNVAHSVQPHPTMAHYAFDVSPYATTTYDDDCNNAEFPGKT